MPSKTFTLDASRPETVTLKWGMFWRNFTVRQNDQEVGKLSGAAKALQQGANFTLLDGRTLSVQLVRQYIFSQGLDVRLEGQLLPGSHTHPRQQIKQALYVLYFLVTVNALLGALALVPGMEVLQELGLGIGSIVTAGVYAGLAYWAKSKNSALAFYLALGLFVVDYIAGLVLIAGSNLTFNPGAGVVVRLFLGVLLYTGAQGAKALRTEQQLLAVQ